MTCSATAHGVLAAHDEHDVGDADSHVGLDDGPEPVHVVGADPDLHRAADLAGVAPDVCAVPVEDLRGRGDLLRSAPGRIPDVRVLRGEPQRAPGAGAADPDGRVRPLHRLGLGDGILQVVVLPREGGARLGPQPTDDLQALLEPVGAVAAATELKAQHGVLVLGPSGADAEVEPPTGQVVDRHRHLGQHPRMPVGVADHRAPDPGAGRQLRHRRQHRPGLEDGSVVVRAQRREVVHHPAAVEPAVVGQAPHVSQLVDGRVLTQLQPEAHGRHPTSHTRCRGPRPDRACGGRGGSGRAIDRLSRRTYAGGADRAAVVRSAWEVPCSATTTPSRHSR